MCRAFANASVLCACESPGASADTANNAMTSPSFLMRASSRAEGLYGKLLARPLGRLNVANNGPTSDSEVRRRHSRPWCSIGVDGGLSPDSLRAGHLAQ